MPPASTVALTGVFFFGFFPVPVFFFGRLHGFLSSRRFSSLSRSAAFSIPVFGGLFPLLSFRLSRTMWSFPHLLPAFGTCLFCLLFHRFDPACCVLLRWPCLAVTWSLGGPVCTRSLLSPSPFVYQWARFDPFCASCCFFVVSCISCPSWL